MTTERDAINDFLNQLEPSDCDHDSVDEGLVHTTWRAAFLAGRKSVEGQVAVLREALEHCLGDANWEHNTGSRLNYEPRVAHINVALAATESLAQAYEARIRREAAEKERERWAKACDMAAGQMNSRNDREALCQGLYESLARKLRRNDAS